MGNLVCHKLSFLAVAMGRSPVCSVCADRTHCYLCVCLLLAASGPAPSRARRCYSSTPFSSYSESTTNRPTHLCQHPAPMLPHPLGTTLMLPHPLGTTLMLPHPLGTTLMLPHPLGTTLMLPHPLGTTLLLPHPLGTTPVLPRPLGITLMLSHPLGNLLATPNQVKSVLSLCCINSSSPHPSTHPTPSSRWHTHHSPCQGCPWPQCVSGELSDGVGGRCNQTAPPV